MRPMRKQNAFSSIWTLKIEVSPFKTVLCHMVCVQKMMNVSNGCVVVIYVFVLNLWFYLWNRSDHMEEFPHSFPCIKGL